MLDHNSFRELCNGLTAACCDKPTAKNLWYSLELVFADNRLIKVFEEDYFDFVAPFQYLGMLSREEEAFGWLPFDLHLTAPIYLNFYPSLFIDYANPNEPTVINGKDIKECGTPNEEFATDSEIVFKQTPISARKMKGYDEGIGHCGIPSWIQYPRIPTCPKSNKTMRFVMQLGSHAKIPVLRKNITSKYSEYDPFKNLHFWHDGDLYVFFEPESKVACYLIQNT